jgi:hypothetical protein
VRISKQKRAENTANTAAIKTEIGQVESEHDHIGPLGPHPPSKRPQLPDQTRREVIIVGNTVKEVEHVGRNEKIVEEWDYKRKGMA